MIFYEPWCLGSSFSFPFCELSLCFAITSRFGYFYYCVQAIHDSTMIVTNHGRELSSKTQSQQMLLRLALLSDTQSHRKPNTKNNT